MLKCRDATRLFSESRERRLDIGETLTLWVHTLMCRACRRFGRQINALGQISRTYTRRRDPAPGGGHNDGP